MVTEKKQGVCVRLDPEHSAAAEALIRHVRDHGRRSLPEDVRASLDACGVDFDCVSDVVRVAMERFLSGMKDNNR